MIELRGNLLSIMVMYCVALHLLWATLILVDAEALNATPVSLFRLWDNPAMVSLTMYMVAFMAMSSMVCSSAWSALLMFPQQILLIISAEAVVFAIASGQFADGVPRPREFIALDQSHVVLASIFHGMAILAHAMRRRRP